MTEDKKVQWHPAFYGAMHLEFRENKGELEFTEEVILNTMPLRVDMLVVKKKFPCEIRNEIGKIERKPVKLFSKLREDKFIVEEKWSGIYYIIKDEYFKIQIVVSEELSWENHIWLNSLSENVSEKYITELIATTQKLKSLDDKNNADALWEVVATINKRTIQKIREDEKMCSAPSKGRSI